MGIQRSFSCSTSDRPQPFPSCATNTPHMIVRWSDPRCFDTRHRIVHPIPDGGWWTRPGERDIQAEIDSETMTSTTTFGRRRIVLLFVFTGLFRLLFCCRLSAYLHPRIIIPISYYNHRHLYPPLEWAHISGSLPVPHTPVEATEEIDHPANPPKRSQFSSVCLSFSVVARLTDPGMRWMSGEIRLNCFIEKSAHTLCRRHLKKRAIERIL